LTNLTDRPINSTVRRRCVQFILVLPLIVAVGLPWVALQSAAWVGMLTDYARTLSLSEAAARTFDGDAPCKLCVAAAQGQSSEDEPGSASAGVRLEGMPEDASVFLASPVVSEPRRLTVFPDSPGTSPPNPPPPEFG